MKLKHKFISPLRKRDTKKKREKKIRLTQEIGESKREKREREEGRKSGKQGESILS